MFKTFFKNTEKEIEMIKVEPSKATDSKESKEIKIELKEEWVWIEGYKGTDENMMCRNTQYELNKPFKFEEDIELCKSGFHFCKKLGDVFPHYNLNYKNRFFKVKGLVKKIDSYKIDDISSYIYSRPMYGSKVVAKEIIFLSELTYKEGLEKYIKKCWPMIENEEEYISCKDKDYEVFCENKFLSEMKILGFSKLFSQIQLEEIDFSKLYDYLKQVRAYKEENISKDIMIYLLENYKRKLIK